MKERENKINVQRKNKLPGSNKEAITTIHYNKD